MNKKLFLYLILGLFLLAVPGVTASHAEGMNPCNPCSKKIPNPCNPCNKGAWNPCNPCYTANPCNPCNQADIKPIRSEHFKSRGELLALGEKLWNDENLGESGLACMTCHEDHESLNLERFNTWRWPHYVEMPKDVMTLDQMINFCILNPIDGTPFEFGSYKITAMAVFYSEYVRSYHGPTASGTKKSGKAATNPCNPCNKKMSNPCNPCGKRMNPCNPCGK